MKKVFKNRIFLVIMTAFICISVTTYAAIKMQANEIGYNDTTVEDALNSLKNNLGPTKVSAQTNVTHKGIIYLDPTDLTKHCNETNSVSTTETKTGCMKWYIYDETESTYKMILDHNTTARIKWNDSNSNVAYENSNLKPLVDLLSTPVASGGSGWVIQASLITVDDINKITGKTGFDSSNTNSYYYLDTNSQSIGSFNSKNRSKYDFLYNNLNKCKTNSTDYGCSVEDNNNYTGYSTAGNGNTWAYWTKTPVGIAGNGSKVWRIHGFGHLDTENSNDGNLGIRPVIEISKNIVK